MQALGVCRGGQHDTVLSESPIGDCSSIWGPWKRVNESRAALFPKAREIAEFLLKASTSPGSSKVNHAVPSDQREEPRYGYKRPYEPGSYTYSASPTLKERLKSPIPTRLEYGGRVFKKPEVQERLVEPGFRKPEECTFQDLIGVRVFTSLS
ncbi:hypothetical protein MTO96_013730 [Rhipicephalus appendiculatus]